jgi:hypothetical protein
LKGKYNLEENTRGNIKINPEKIVLEGINWIHVVRIVTGGGLL